jgi:hypothetical protein
MIGFDNGVYSLLAVAVQEQILILADYNGQRRLLCPHSLGTNRKGQTNVLCYQSGGGSNSGIGHPGSDSNWRCFRVDKLEGVELCPSAPWSTGGNHSCDNTCVANVDVQVN